MTQLNVKVQAAPFTGDGDGWRIQIEDENSGKRIAELRLTIEHLGELLSLIDKLDDLGKRHEWMTLSVDWLADRKEWTPELLDGETIDQVVRKYLALKHKDLWRAGWRPDRLASDGSTKSTGFNPHKVTPDGYEITLRRYVAVEEES